MFRTIPVLLLLLCCAARSVAGVAPGEYPLRSGRAVLHAGPGFGTEVVGILEGTGPWRVVEARDGWARIADRGWVPEGLLEAPPEGRTPAAPPGVSRDVEALGSGSVPPEPEWDRATVLAALLAEERARIQKDERRRADEQVAVLRAEMEEERLAAEERAEGERRRSAERERSEGAAEARRAAEREMAALRAQLETERTRSARLERERAEAVARGEADSRARESAIPPAAPEESLRAAREEGYRLGRQEGVREGREAALADLRKEESKESVLVRTRERELKEARELAREEGRREGYQAGLDAAHSEAAALDRQSAAREEQAGNAAFEEGRAAGRAEGLREAATREKEGAARAEEDRAALVARSREEMAMAVARAREEGRASGLEEASRASAEASRSRDEGVAARVAEERRKWEREREGAAETAALEARRQALQEAEAEARSLRQSHRDEVAALEERIRALESAAAESEERLSRGRRGSRREATETAEGPRAGWVPAEELERARSEAQREKVRAIQAFYQEIESTFSKRLTLAGEDSRARCEHGIREVLAVLAPADQRRAREAWDAALAGNDLPRGGDSR